MNPKEYAMVFNENLKYDYVEETKNNNHLGQRCTSQLSGKSIGEKVKMCIVLYNSKPKPYIINTIYINLWSKLCTIIIFTTFCCHQTFCC